MNGDWLDGPFQAFIFLPLFWLIMMIIGAATRSRATIKGGRHVLSFNIPMRLFCVIFSCSVIALDGGMLWVSAMDFTNVKSHLMGTIAIILASLPLQAIMIFFIRSVFGTRISFDSHGVYQKRIHRPEMLLRWSEISYCNGGGQIQIFVNGSRKIFVSRYQNGREELVSELKSHNVPSK